MNPIENLSRNYSLVMDIQKMTNCTDAHPHGVPNDRKTHEQPTNVTDMNPE